jgi:hypothetical protein
MLPVASKLPDIIADPVYGNPSIPVSWEPSPVNVVALTGPTTVSEPVIPAEPVNGNPSIPLNWEPSPTNEPEKIEEVIVDKNCGSRRNSVSFKLVNSINSNNIKDLKHTLRNLQPNPYFQPNP